MTEQERPRLDTNERPGPFDLAELTGTIENAPIGHLQTALGGNGELLALWIKRMYGQRLRVAGLNASESPPTETNPLYKTWTDSDEAVMAREDVAIKAEATTPETHEGRMLVAMFPHDADYWRNRVRAIEDEMNLRWEERLSRPNDGLDMERLIRAMNAHTANEAYEHCGGLCADDIADEYRRVGDTSESPPPVEPAMSEPTTEAGRDMLRRHLTSNPNEWLQTPQDVSRAIVAIEEEAGAGRAVQDDGLDMERLADALDAVTWSVLARLRAAPPLHDPQEPER